MGKAKASCKGNRQGIALSVISNRFDYSYLHVFAFEHADASAVRSLIDKENIMHRFVLFTLGCLVCTSAIVGQTFTISVSPHSATTNGADTKFYVHVTPSGGYAASVYLSATIPSLPGATLVFGTSILNPPFTDSAYFTVQLTGAKTGGTHAIIVNGKNGPVSVYDTAQLTIPLKTAWQVFNTTNSQLPDNSISCVVVEKNGRGWFGTPKGLASFDGTDFIVYDGTTGFPPALTGDHRDLAISGMAIDSQGGLWVSTGSMLVKCLNGAWTNYTKSTFGQPWFRQVTVDTHGHVWVSTNSNGVLEYDGATWKRYKTMIDTVTALPDIGTIMADDSGAVWMCASNPMDGGMYRFDGMFWSTIVMPSVGNLMAYMCTDTHGNVWVTATGGSTMLMEYAGTHRISFRDTVTNTGLGWAPDFPGESPKVLAFDSQGDAWIGERFSPSGLKKFYNGTSDFYTIQNSGLPSNTINALAVGPNLNIWVATDAGIAILDGTRSGYTAPSGVNDAAQPSSMTLHASVYPNPVVSSSRLFVSNSEETRIRATLVNSLGIVVASVFDQNVSAGDHQVNFSTRNIPAGMYFLRMEGSGQVQTIPVAIVR